MVTMSWYLVNVVFGQLSRLAVVLDFGDTKNGKLFFLNPYASKHKIKSKIAFKLHIAWTIDSVLH